MPASPRRQQLERLLEATPGDPFLLYGIALEVLKEGDDADGLERLRAVGRDFPDYHAAHFQLGQVLGRRDEVEEARQWLEKGVAAARRTGDLKAANEMQEFLESI